MRTAWLILGTVMVVAAGPEPALRQVDATGVLGRSVHDAGGHDIGRIVDVVVEPSGQPDAVVVDTGGFMGVGSRRVAIDWAAVHVPPPGSADMTVTIDLTDDQVRSAPAYNDRSKPATVVGSPGGSQPADAPPAASPATPASPTDTGSGTGSGTGASTGSNIGKAPVP